MFVIEKVPNPLCFRVQKVSSGMTHHGTNKWLDGGVLVEQPFYRMVHNFVKKKRIKCFLLLAQQDTRIPLFYTQSFSEGKDLVLGIYMLVLSCLCQAAAITWSGGQMETQEAISFTFNPKY